MAGKLTLVPWMLIPPAYVEKIRLTHIFQNPIADAQSPRLMLEASILHA